jgi:serine/threonine-protein kinase
MGAVFVAQHTATEALVALKVLWPHVMEHDQARQNFELEAKIAARVRNEHIVKVLDAGLDGATGSPFLVMELLEGTTLAEHVLSNGPRPWLEVVDWMSQVARGLDAAHGHRSGTGASEPIVHRDLKPENLFLTTDIHGAPLVKILDFGIAKVLSESTHLSREVRGTPRYMAYEQVAGEDISPRTDVWALGLITYFMLTGRCYWRSIERVEALFAEILNRPLPAPSQRAQEDGIAIELPAGFDAWLLRCIHRDPSRRFASAGEAMRALAAIEAPSHLGPTRAGSEDAVIGATTETLGGGLGPATVTVGSLPSLTKALPERTAGLKLRKTLVAAGVGAVVAGTAGGFWLLRIDDGGAGGSAVAPGTANLAATRNGARAPVNELPDPPIVTPAALPSVSQSNAAPAPPESAHPARGAGIQRPNRRALSPLPPSSRDAGALSTSASKPPPIFVELPPDPPPQHRPTNR